MHPGPDRWPLYRLAGREVGRALRNALVRPLVRPFLLLRPRPRGLVIAPHDLRTSDPTVAADIYSGLFLFAGRSLATGGRSPFDYEPPTPAWGEALHGFGWLRHLRAADNALARDNARALVADFIARGGRVGPTARRTPVAARRLIAFLSQSPLVLEGADHAFYRAFLRAVARGVRDLERDLAGGGSGVLPEDRLLAAIALAYAGLCCEGLGATLARASRIVSRELDRQILADGGHVGRDPRLVVDLLLDLLPLRQSFLSRGAAPPEALVRALDRMLPFLRLVRHGDGSLSHFNGVGVSAADHLATLLAYEGARGGGRGGGIGGSKGGSTGGRAPRSGYERLEAGGSLLVAETGRAPPLPFSREAHAGALSFEFSSGARRLVVNCGAARGGGGGTGEGEARRLSRTTAAHSVLVLAQTSSARFLDPDAPGLWWFERRLARWLAARLGAVVLRGPRRVEAERGLDERGAGILVARHDGYARPDQPAGGRLVHERRLRLAPDGGRLEGEDLLLPATGRRRGPRAGRRAGPRGPALAIRFHLHPAVRASRVAGGRTVLLVLPDGEAWAFEAEGAEVGIEESVFFASVTGARRTAQIVLRREAAGPGVEHGAEELGAGPSADPAAGEVSDVGAPSDPGGGGSGAAARVPPGATAGGEVRAVARVRWRLRRLDERLDEVRPDEVET